MVTPNRNIMYLHKNNKQQRRIPMHWVVIALLFGLPYYLVQESVFSSSSSTLSSLTVGIKQEYLKVWDWKTQELGDQKQHMEFVRMASEVVPRKKHYDINYVHQNGLLHSGMGAAVLDTNITMADAKIMLLKRAPHLATCPNSWSLMGEHTHQDETPEDTVIRGMKEMLGEAFYAQFVQQGKTMTLLKHPVYVNANYSHNGSLIDRQITYLHVIEMNTPLDELENMLKLDREATEVRWMTRHEIQDGWMDFNPSEKFCSHELTLLLQLVLHRLEDFEKEANAAR